MTQLSSGDPQKISTILLDWSTKMVATIRPEGLSISVAANDATLPSNPRALHSLVLFAPLIENPIGAGSGIRGLGFNYVIRKDDSNVELYIDRGTGQDEVNKQIFDWLQDRKDSIEQVFGSPLSWQRLEEKRSCRIAFHISSGGYRSDEALWPAIHDEMINSMVKLEESLRPHLEQCKRELISA